MMWNFTALQNLIDINVTSQELLFCIVTTVRKLLREDLLYLKPHNYFIFVFPP
jgi:hypothetical protein